MHLIMHDYGVGDRVVTASHTTVLLSLPLRYNPLQYWECRGSKNETALKGCYSTT